MSASSLGMSPLARNTTTAAKDLIRVKPIRRPRDPQIAHAGTAKKDKSEMPMMPAAVLHRGNVRGECYVESGPVNPSRSGSDRKMNLSSSDDKVRDTLRNYFFNDKWTGQIDVEHNEKVYSQFGEKIWDESGIRDIYNPGLVRTALHFIRTSEYFGIFSLPPVRLKQEDAIEVVSNIVRRLYIAQRLLQLIPAIQIQIYIPASDSLTLSDDVCNFMRGQSYNTDDISIFLRLAGVPLETVGEEKAIHLFAEYCHIAIDYKINDEEKLPSVEAIFSGLKTYMLNSGLRDIFEGDALYDATRAILLMFGDISYLTDERIAGNRISTASRVVVGKLLNHAEMMPRNKIGEKRAQKALYGVVKDQISLPLGSIEYPYQLQNYISETLDRLKSEHPELIGSHRPIEPLKVGLMFLDLFEIKVNVDQNVVGEILCRWLGLSSTLSESADKKSKIEELRTEFWSDPIDASRSKARHLLKQHDIINDYTDDDVIESYINQILDYDLTDGLAANRAQAMVNAYLEQMNNG